MVEHSKRSILMNSSVVLVWLMMAWSFGIPVQAATCSNPACNSLYTPDLCAGTVSTVFLQAGLTTQGKQDQDTYNCGSENNDLADVIVQFTAGVTGIYQIDTEDITSPTTLQVESCDATVLACNAKRNSTDLSSLVLVSLTAGTNYIIGVSKEAASDAETTFTLRIELVTSSPTSAPTVPTKSPTVATESPTVATNAPVSTGAPISATNPSSAPTTTLNSGNLSTAVGGGIGGFAALALGIAVGRRTINRRRSALALSEKDAEVWTPEDEAKLRMVFHDTHDLHSLYPIFPNHSRESVAFRTRQLLVSKTSFYQMQAPRLAKSTYLFVNERKKRLTSAFSSKAHSHTSGVASVYEPPPSATYNSRNPSFRDY